MKAAEATDSLRASARPSRDLPCHPRDLCPNGKRMERGGESLTASSCPGPGTPAKLPTSRALADACNRKNPPVATAGMPRAAGTERDALNRDHVLTNLTQTGGIKSRCYAPSGLGGAGSMAARRRCSCDELNSLSSGTLVPNGCKFTNSFSSCNCNVENCAGEEGFSSVPPLKSQPLRSSSDQSNTNAALHRALASMKKTAGEMNGVKNAQPKPIPSFQVTDLRSCEASDTNARSIANSDARTLSMRERGRWGNSKMQQQLFGTPACGVIPASYGQNVRGNPSLERQQLLQQNHPLQRVQCLHCGSFSTTPVSSIGQGGRSQSFGRKLRDFSWQQELLQEHRRPEPQMINKEAVHQAVPLPSAALQDVAAHTRCECTAVTDPTADFEHFHGAQHMNPPKHVHGVNVMSWQERYMLLCQAIAAGAFVDGCPDDMSGPMFPSNRGYSWAVCECTACESGCGMAETMGYRQGPSSFCNTTTGERMMELEAFSGPIGYVSESKAGAEMRGTVDKQASGGRRRRWWARLPSFGKSKSDGYAQAAAAAPGHKGGVSNAAAQCSSCGQRLCIKGEEEPSRRLCGDCAKMSRLERCESGPIPTTRPLPSRAARPPPPPLFSRHQKHLPRRWRLMKLCRYLMGFPLQR